MVILYLRERAHGAKAHSRTDERNWQAESGRAIQTPEPGWGTIQQRGHAGEILTCMWALFWALGEWMLTGGPQVYFGFTHCPDICPDELDKMALMYDKVTAECGQVLLPIMISCDPARDNPKVLKEYLTEFHPDLIGLTGAYEEIKDTCKAYRVYFSTPQSVKPGEDYLVDHSIYFYLMGKRAAPTSFYYGDTNTGLIVCRSRGRLC